MDIRAPFVADCEAAEAMLRSASHPPRKHLPGNPGSQHEQNAGQDRAVRNRRATVPVSAAAPSRRNQGRQPLPDRVVDQVIGHARPYQVSGLSTRGPLAEMRFRVIR
jgi:hypothetical protein